MQENNGRRIANKITYGLEFKPVLRTRNPRPRGNIYLGSFSFATI